MRGKMSRLYEEFGFKKINGFLDRRLQILVAVEACNNNHKGCMEKAKYLFNRWRDGHMIPSDFQYLVLYNGVHNGGEEEWNFVFNQYLREKVPSLKVTLLISLCATKEPRLMEKLMQYSQNSSIIRTQDVRYIFRYIPMFSNEGRNHAWKFVKDNWSTLIEKYSEKLRVVTRIVSYVVSGFGSMEDYNQVTEFFTEERIKETGKAVRTLKQSLEKIKGNHQWSVNHAEEVTNWLKVNVKT